MKSQCDREIAGSGVQVLAYCKRTDQNLKHNLTQTGPGILRRECCHKFSLTLN